MASKSELPQLSGDLFLTDGGLETTLIFHRGIDLPYFGAFDLLKDQAGRDVLRSYFDDYLAIARSNGCGFILESATWRASADWGDKLGYSSEALAAINRAAIQLLLGIKRDYAAEPISLVISGCVGPRGDGYSPSSRMTGVEAQHYHQAQIDVFSTTAAEMISAMTMNYVEEAIGIARAAQAAGLPSSISFTVETDGRLPTGQTLQDAIAEVDAATDRAPAYYMINCAHPSHFESALVSDSKSLNRIRGLRANASCRSHAELDEAAELDEGNPQQLGKDYDRILSLLPQLNVLGGCCGTDHRHVGEIAAACAALFDTNSEPRRAVAG
jgi:S-methylmethionine-dependent homocysteine/selenocysteine methylase